MIWKLHVYPTTFWNEWMTFLQGRVKTYSDPYIFSRGQEPQPQDLRHCRPILVIFQNIKASCILCRIVFTCIQNGTENRPSPFWTLVCHWRRLVTSCSASHQFVKTGRLALLSSNCLLQESSKSVFLHLTWAARYLQLHHHKRYRPTWLMLATITTTIRLRLDCRSTACQRSQWRNSLSAVTLTYLFV